MRLLWRCSSYPNITSLVSAYALRFFARAVNLFMFLRAILLSTRNKKLPKYTASFIPLQLIVILCTLPMFFLHDRSFKVFLLRNNVAFTIFIYFFTFLRVIGNTVSVNAVQLELSREEHTITQSLGAVKLSLLERSVRPFIFSNLFS